MSGFKTSNLPATLNKLPALPEEHEEEKLKARADIGELEAEIKRLEIQLQTYQTVAIPRTQAEIMKKQRQIQAILDSLALEVK